MSNLFARLNSRRTQRLAAAQKEQVPAEIDKPKEKKSLFGKLLEKTGEWVRPLSRARVNAADLPGKPEWEEAKNLDLSEQTKLPANFTAPAKLEKIRFNYDADQEGGIAKDPALLKSLPAERTVQAEFTVSTKQIFNLLQNKPEKLTAEMANVITGAREGINGLSDEALFSAIQRLENKFEASQLDKIDVEVKNILLEKLESSSNRRIWAKTKEFKNFLTASKYEDQVVESKKTSPSKEGTQKAMDQEINLLKAEILRPAELAEAAGLGTMDIDGIAKRILEENITLIKKRSQLKVHRRPERAENYIKQQLESIFINVQDKDIKDALMQITFRSLQRLETRFENTGTQKAKVYNRLTALNNGSKEKLLYATALMERNSGILPGSKNYGIKALAS